MSLTGALNAALSSLRVNQAALQVTSANIAHANDPNYTTKSIDRTSVELGEGQIGGVSISAFRPAINASLKRQWEGLISQSGYSAIQADYTARIGDLLGASSDQPRLVSLIGDLIAGFQALEANPDSASAKQALIATAQNLTTEIHSLADGLDGLSRDLSGDVSQSVDQVNDLLGQVFAINVQLRSSTPDSAEHADLIDSRDKVLRSLSELVDIRSIEHSDGSVTLLTYGGLNLLDGAPVRIGFDGTNLLRLDDGSDISASFRSGKLRGLLDLSSTQPAADPAKAVIYKLRAQLDALVKSFTDPTSAFASTYNQADYSQRINGSVVKTISASTTEAQHSSLDFTGTVQVGDKFDLTLNGKRFSFQATNQTLTLDDIAAQLSALIDADTTIGVTAIAGAGGLQLVGANINQAFSATLRINGQIPELGQNFFTGTDRYSFQLNDQLAQGATTVKRNAAGATLAALTSTSNGFDAGGLTISNASYQGVATSILGTHSANVKILRDKAQFDTQSLSLTEQRYHNETGVNLDAELANLQVIQNAYAASARILTVVQSLYDQLQAAISR